MVDKWLAVQAGAESTQSLDTVKALVQHPGFDIKNPNKVRALLGAYAGSFPPAFHRKDGAGYAFLADQILVLDKLNPQLAARMTAPLARWRQFDPGARRADAGGFGQAGRYAAPVARCV